MKKFIKIALYALSALLLAAYLFVITRPLDDNLISIEYRMYYLNSDLAYYLPDDAFKTTYCANSELSYALISDEPIHLNNIGSGWGTIGNEGIWTSGDESYFYLYVDDLSTDYELVLHVRDSLGYHNEILVNGNSLGLLECGEDDVIVDIPSSALINGINKFEIRTSDTVGPMSDIRPESNDPNPYNLFLSGMVLRNKDT